MIDYPFQSTEALLYFPVAASVTSFLGVIYSRTPYGRSILGRSICENCGKKIPMRFNLPIIGWIILKGKCYFCHFAIPAELFLMECLGLFLYLLIWLRFDSLSELGIWFLYVSFGLVLSFIDFKHLRLPNILTYPFFILTSSFVVFKWLILGSVKDIEVAFYSGIGCFIFYLALRLISRGGVGLGDVKLAPTIGIICGLYSYGLLVLSTYISFLIAGLLAAFLLLTKKANRKTPIPLGPFMLASPLLITLIS